MSADLEKGFYSLISGQSPLTTAGARIYPRVPQNPTFPLIRFQRIVTSRNHALDSTVGVTEAVLQVDCMAESYSGAKTLADEVRAILHGFSGSWGNLKAHLVSLDTENDDFEQDGDRVTHWVTQRYNVHTNMD